jgi:hypothetical protein
MNLADLHRKAMDTFHRVCLGEATKEEMWRDIDEFTDQVVKVMMKNIHHPEYFIQKDGDAV